MCFGKSILLGCLVLVNFLSTEAVLSFHDENFFEVEADRYDWSKHPCNRLCDKNTKPKTCYYVFVVETYLTMSKACYDCPSNMTDCFRPHCLPADGKMKTVYTVNRLLPGPSIEVCHGDKIVVEVRNLMLSESTTIHWHGIDQEGTPYMDGVPYVTQCPILPGERFRYIFKPLSSGTFFWHSHIGTQRTTGLFGALIIHPSVEMNIHGKLYDHDIHHITVTDWSQRKADIAMAREYYDKIGNSDPNTMLINGLGRFQRNDNETVKSTPITVFEVEKAKRYRLRLIDAGAEDCPIEMSIDNHTMLVISLDSNDIEPVEVDAITIWPGERVDFVLNANQIIDNYWIRFRGYGWCQSSNTKGVYQVAIIRYANATIEDPKSPVGYDIPKQTNTTRILNPYNTGTEVSNPLNVEIPLLSTILPNDPALSETADKQIYIAFGFYPLDNYDFQRADLYGYNQVPKRNSATLQFNHISLKLPPFPLLSQPELITPNLFCNSTTVSEKNCTVRQCTCTHVLQVKFNSVVELIFVDEGRIAIVNHPLHLHGHFFRIIAMENLEGPATIDRVKQLDKAGKITRRLDRAPLKDTIKAPSGGYTIVRFIANNPGYWFFHCHFDQHNNIGMSLVFKVGEHEDFPPVPRNFPKCGSYTPSVM